MEQTVQQGNGAVNGNAAQSQANSHEAREKLMNDLKLVIGDAESWLKEAKRNAAHNAGEAQARFDDTLRTAKTDLLRLQDSMTARGKLAAQSANGYVKGHAWQAVGLGAAVGVIAGLLLARR
ncbi:MAG TPA: DUF883 domain-containing protein [Burkholderiaceae bacterium]|nr:DUF883 domain-containing protein [Burkholderiaceae bacterium]